MRRETMKRKALSVKRDKPNKLNGLFIPHNLRLTKYFSILNSTSLIIIFLISILSSVSCIQKREIKYPSEIHPTEEYNQAINAYNEGNLDMALALFNKFEKKYPNSLFLPKLWYFRGIIYASKKDYDRAFLDFSRAAPQVPDAKRYIKNIYQFVSIKYLLKGVKFIQSKTLLPRILFTAAKKLYKTGNEKDALKMYRKIYNNFPETIDGEEAKRIISKKKLINIGALLPLSGTYKYIGNELKEGIVIASYYKDFYPIFSDTKGNPIIAYKMAKKLKDRKVKGFIGPILSTNILTVGAISDIYKIPLISPTATDESLEQLSPYIMLINRSLIMEGKAIAHYAHSELGFMTAAALFPATHYGRTLENAFVQEFNSLGGNVLVEVSYSPEKTDFKQEITRIKDKNPELIFIPAYTEEISLIAPQLKYYEVKSQIFGGDGWKDNSLLESDADKGYLEGVVCADLPYSPDSLFVSKFQEVFGNKPSRHSALGYDAANLLFNILNSKGNFLKIKKTIKIPLTAGFLNNEEEIQKVPIYIITNGTYQKVN